MNRVRPLEEWVSRLSTADTGEGERALEVLGEALCAQDADVRERTARLLLEELARPGAVARGRILSLLQTSWWPPPARLADTAFQAVLAALARTDVEAPEVDEAALVLANVCRVAPEQLTALEAALGQVHPAIRRAAAGAVGRVGEAAVSLLPRLLARLDDVEPVAGAALESLGSLAPLAPHLATPALLEQVAKAEGARLYLALASLRGLLEEGRREGRAVPALASLEPALLRAAEGAEPPIRLEAVSLLGVAGLSSPASLATLRGHLQDASPAVAACAAVALLRLGAPPAEALALLSTQLSSEHDPELAGAALSALEGVEPATLARAKGMLSAVALASRSFTGEAVRALLAQLP